MFQTKYYLKLTRTFRRSKKVAFFMIILLIIATQNCALRPLHSDGENYVAKVGNKMISFDEFNNEISKLHTSKRVGKELSVAQSFAKQDYTKFLDELIDNKLLAIGAEKLKLDQDIHFKNKMHFYLLNISLEKLRNVEIISKIDLSDETIKKRFDELLKKGALPQGPHQGPQQVSNESAPGSAATEEREMKQRERKGIITMLIAEKEKALSEEYINKLRQRSVITIYSDILIDLSPDNKDLLGKAVADVNGEVLTVRMLLNELKKRDKYNDHEYVKKQLDSIITRKLLDQEAMSREFINDKIVKAKLDRYSDQMLANLFPRKVIVPMVSIEDQDVLDYYEKNIDNYRKSDVVNLGMIVVEDEKEAFRVYDDLKKGADFSSLAEQVSTDRSSNDGGDVGWLDINTLPPDIRDLMYNSKPVELLGPFGMDIGFAVIEFRGLKKREPVPFDDVRTQIYLKLARESYNSLLKEYIERLRETVPITINRKVLSEN